ncbi:hypothetical protein [Spirochaeta cellobiosiphila]|uniref:hypothetical protein n=1 Tax=Spirochaeta cellobiosiphila TaxID=504483 RepID=UPI0004248E71|nr:hypothetical protein [Spirochaeta cellobiosiphila]
MIGTIFQVLASWQVQIVIGALLVILPLLFFLGSAPVSKKENYGVKKMFENFGEEKDNEE